MAIVQLPSPALFAAGIEKRWDEVDPFTQAFRYTGGGKNTDIAHNQYLFEFFIKIIVDFRSAPQNGINSACHTVARFL